MKTTTYLKQKAETQETILKDEIISEIKKACEEDKKYDLELEDSGIWFRNKNGVISGYNLYLLSSIELISIFEQIEAENERSKQSLHNFATDLAKRTEIHAFKKHFDDSTDENLNAINENKADDVLGITLTVNGKTLELINSPEVYHATMQLLDAAIQVETELNS